MLLWLMRPRALIRAREVAGLIELPKPPRARPGDAVRILRGPFEGRLAVYAGMKPRQRIEVLVGLLTSPPMRSRRFKRPVTARRKALGALFRGWAVSRRLAHRREMQVI